ncbi:putative polyketide synthase [Lasiosphaeris hirsuta]|uniref:Polyketide synthase n=1 Tax=Lasiosphaeris hirsuta TaxID=260670 RepID=A0AA40B0Q4_9PEZI|nr:putative polyketide synthase [Lasiosphaeris hirsuta]
MAYKRPIREPIAIVGSGCRFAGGVTSPSSLWELLSHPTDLAQEIPKTRFNIQAFYHPNGEYHGTTNSPKAYFLQQDHRVFDASFFNITPKEAEAIDPQQRMLLEVVYEALESAGYSLHQHSGKNVAVYSGLMTADYDTLSQRDDLTASQYYATGVARSILANRVSYFFNFHGPSMTIDTACSSSLVALHQAVLSLRSGESEMACVTGVNLIITPEQFSVESNLHMLSPTGHCRMWDVGADGYARGEGVTAMFIKPLSRALADGDRIEAVIRETGVNSDGRSQGITMPNWKAQSMLIQNTYSRAGLDSKDPVDRCQYFEAHGTGTNAGDPNEARAIEDAFFGHGAEPEPLTPKLIVGSVKTIIGHTEGAAGLAGLFKVVQAMRHDTIPPNLHLEKINPNVKQYCANLSVPTRTLPWPHVFDGQPKRASVNSFGFGGTNSHAIVEQYVPALHNEVAKLFWPHLKIPKRLEYGGCARRDQIRLPFLLSANSAKSLVNVVKAYRDYLARVKPPHLEDVAWHAYARRTAFPFRVAVVGHSVSDIVDRLDNLAVKADKSLPPTIGIRARPDDEQPKILGIFTGQGAQWATMSRGLLQTSKVYSHSIRVLDEILQACPHPPSWRLEQEILAEKGLSRVEKAAISQPLCTALQVAMVDLLRSLGVNFHTVVGHSSGEIAAAYAAGRLSARDAILISYYRGSFAHLACGAGGSKGSMIAVGLSKEEAAELCARREYSHGICIAASNAASSVTLSGDIDIVNSIHDELTRQGKFARVLLVDTAYHSPHMELPAARYLEALEQCRILPSGSGNGTKWVSSVYGAGEPEDAELKSSYWKDNMVKPVLFYEALETALKELGPFDCAVEVGPHAALKGPATQIMAKNGNHVPYAGLLDRKSDDRVAFAEFLGWMWTQFGSASPQIRHFVLNSTQPDLVDTMAQDSPLYPWDHSQTHYRESRISRQFHFKTDAPHELLGVRTRDDNEFELRWRNILRLDRIPWAKHHSFQGQPLLPASAYLVMALDAARVLLAGRPASIIELQDLKFPAGIILEPDAHGVEVLFSLVVDQPAKGRAAPSAIGASFTMTSAVADGRTSMTKNFTGRLRIILGAPSAQALPSRPKVRVEALHANSDMFYDMMADTGLVYTGPFKGLSHLERRFCFASGILKKLHDEDTTRLSISPATLDSCLQTAFVSVSSPGDRAIWTSFLPKKIERVRFNLAICDIKDREGKVVTDTYLTDAKPITRQTAASFTAEIDIFDSHGNMEIQIDGLTVGSFSPTKPEDDMELYLTTAMEVDPEVEIVSTTLSDIHVPSPMLIESCERVASFYINIASIRRMCQASQRALLPPGYELDCAIAATPWPTETAKSLDDFIVASPYYSALDFIRRLGQNLPDVLAGMLPAVVEEAHQLTGFQRHVSRVVRQIAHKYPRMNVLGLTDSELGITEHVLAGLGESFVTLRVGGEAEKNLGSRVLASPSIRKRVIVREMPLDKEILENAGVQYDLVLLTTSMMENQNTRALLQKIRCMMRPGGFLVLVHISRSPLKDRIRRCARVEVDDNLSTPPDWPDVLDESGFAHSVIKSHQYYPPGFSITVRQAESHEKHLLLKPFAKAISPQLTERLLVIGGKGLTTSLISSGVSQVLTRHCGSITTVETPENVDLDCLSSISAAILLNDIDEPILATMTSTRLEALRALLRPEMTILWITHGARHNNPDHASSFGFTRTLSAETPGLVLQVLDLKTLDTAPAVRAISETFARLTMRYIIDEAPEPKPLWVHEPEVHIEDGHVLVPRVLPWKDGIRRANAVRRVITKSVNTVESWVEIVSDRLTDSSANYRTILKEVDLRLLSESGSQAIQVDYSTTDVLNLGWAYSAYVCVGRDTLTGKTKIALSKSNGSYVALPSTCISNISQAPLNQPVLLALVVRYLAAITIANTVQSKSVLLIEPDPMLQKCVKDILVNRGVWFRVCATNAKRCKLDPAMTFIHPRSTAREIKALYPPGGAWIFNLLPDTDDVSILLSASLPENCLYSPRSALLSSEPRNAQEDHKYVEGIWEEAVRLALSRSVTQSTDLGPAMMTVPALLGSPKTVPPFQILDWKAERFVRHDVEPLVETGMMNAEKTYVLIGITRDFGQSLCSLFVEHGARYIVLASRSPPKHPPKWQEELQAKGIDVRFEALDVMNLGQVRALKTKVEETMPPVGGIVNGAMVLEDRVFSEMSLETLQRVMGPKTVGSKNLDMVFDSPDLEFFIMTSSFAAVGGHGGQSNYAAANMYMNGLAASRRLRGLPASVLNIGVIYGLGFLHREKDSLYLGLAREGYPPISERDIHHMFLEAIAAGRPFSGQIVELTSGLRRYPASNPTMHWHRDPRFSHYTYEDDEHESAANAGGDRKKNLKEMLVFADTEPEVIRVLISAFTNHLENLLHYKGERITGEDRIVDLGVDSLVAVEIRSWLWKNVAHDVAVMKILGAASIKMLCRDIAKTIMEARLAEAKMASSLGLDGGLLTPTSTNTSGSDDMVTKSSDGISTPTSLVSHGKNK